MPSTQLFPNGRHTSRERWKICSLCSCLEAPKFTDATYRVYDCGQAIRLHTLKSSRPPGIAAPRCLDSRVAHVWQDFIQTSMWIGGWLIIQIFDHQVYQGAFADSSPSAFKSASALSIRLRRNERVASRALSSARRRSRAMVE